MKKIFPTLLLLLFSTLAMAQTYFYKGNSTYSGNILYTWDGKHLYKGNSTYSGNILSTMDGMIPVPILLMIL